MAWRVRQTGSGQARPRQSTTRTSVSCPLMSELFSRLIGILMLRNGPQDLPAGSRPLTLAMAFYVAATAMSLSLGEGGPDNPVAALALATVLPMILVRIVLGLRGRPARWNQTLAALFGSSALITLLSMPLGASASAGGEPDPVLVIASLVLFFWSFAVDAHIWRHALDTTFAAGLAVAVLLFTISMYTITLIAGPF